jgi:NDP-sugar pyrophosphorylase family protein
VTRNLPTVCILAGGLGTRLGELTANTPKPLIEVAGEPFLIHQLRLLASYGARDVVLCVGHLGHSVQERIGDEQFGIDIRYSYDGPKLDGTLGAVRRARGLLGERFLVLYGDTYLRIDYADFNQKWIESGLEGAMSVLRNKGQWDRSNAIYAEGRVVRYEKGTDDPEMEWIDYGLGALTAPTLDQVGQSEKDLSALYRVLAQSGELFGYVATERFYEIGTPSALEETSQFLANTFE